MTADVDEGSDVSFHSHDDDDDECSEGGSEFMGAEPKHGDFANGGCADGGCADARVLCAELQTPTAAGCEGTYGPLNMLFVRAAILEAERSVPQEFVNLKVVDVRLCSFPAVVATSRRRGGAAAADRQGGAVQVGTNGGPVPATSDDDDAISEGEHGDPTGPAPWSGRVGSWWRVHNQLGEDLLVREGVSIRSSVMRSVPPGELVQQAGNARSLLSGCPKGCIRLPIRPYGWVTADATRAGGPKCLVRASVPRWRVVYCPPENGKRNVEGGVIVREGEELDSEEVMVLHRGDVVEQAAPSSIRPNRIVRMPVTATVIRRADVESGEVPDPTVNGHGRSTTSGKTLGWVTADASAAGGPVFFKPVAETDRGDKYGQQRRRRPKA